MNSEVLFGMALGLQSPWKVRGIDFKAGLDGRNELHIKIGFSLGAKFPDSVGGLCGVHDTVSRQWQHLNFFEHTCYLHWDVSKIKTIAMPWSRPKSRFALMFEALVMAIIEREMLITLIAQLLPIIFDTNAWNAV